MMDRIVIEVGQVWQRNDDDDFLVIVTGFFTGHTGVVTVNCQEDGTTGGFTARIGSFLTDFEPLAAKEGREVRLEHGWMTYKGYICDGCTVAIPHEHRCHKDDGGPKCVCVECRFSWNPKCPEPGCPATVALDELYRAFRQHRAVDESFYRAEKALGITAASQA